MSWANVVGVGISLAGASSSRRRAREASGVSRENAARVNATIPSQGSFVGAGIGGPSFTFGGPTGSNGQLVGSSANPLSATLGIAEQGSTSSAGVFRDPTTGVIFNGLTGEPINSGAFVGENQSFLDINIPNFAPNFGALGAINSELTSLGNRFNEAGQATSSDLLEIADQAGELLPRVATGASEIREARRNQLNNAESASIGDLRESINRRRLSGSSFANDSISRSQAEFGERRAEADALSSLEEITATAQILGFQSQVINQAGNQLLAALGGELSTLQQRSSNEQFRIGATLQANQLQFAAEAQALSLAFQGQQIAQDYITSLLQIANGATDIQASALTNQSSLDAGFANAGLAAIGGLSGGGAGGGSRDDLLDAQVGGSI